MKILALDAATSACSAALWEDGDVRARRLETLERGQAEVLMGMVGDVLARAGCDYSALDLVAVTCGPGAFTGLRIGLAAARGLALALGLPCLGVTTLEAVAHGVGESGGVGESERHAKTLLVVLESKRADVYAQAFGADLEPLSPPAAVLPGGLADLIPSGPVVVVGDAAARGAQALAAAGVDAVLGGAPAVPDAAIVAAIAARRWRPEETTTPPAPLYLRPPDATLPKNNGRQRA